MAIKQVLIDDLDGTEGAHTHTLEHNGVAIEIDLSTANGAKLEREIKKYFDAGRKAGRPSTRRTKVTNPQSKSDNDAIRAWATKKGKKVSDRGRIPRDIVDAFNADHDAPAFSNSGGTP